MGKIGPGSSFQASEIGISVAVLTMLWALAWMLWSAHAIILAGLFEDIFVPWDAGARWNARQWPSLDFPSSLGPVYYALQGWGFDFSGGAATSIVKANVLAFFFTFPVLVYVLFSRFPPIVAAVAVLCFGAWMLSPRLADFGSKMHTHLASYNRHGLIWGALVILLAALPWRNRRECNWQRVTDGILVGLILLVSALTKITFAVFAGSFFAVYIMVRFYTDRLALFTLYLTAILTITLGLAWLEWTVPGLVKAYILDIIYAASIQSGGLFPRLFGNLDNAIMYLLLETLMAFVVLGVILTRIGIRAILKPLGAALLSLLTLAMMMGQVHDIYGPIIAISMLVFFGAALPLLELELDSAAREIVQFAVLPCLLVAAAIETASIGQHFLYSRRVSLAPEDYLGFADKGLFLSEGYNPLPSSYLDEAAARSTLAAVREGRTTPEEWNNTGRLKALEFFEIWADARILLDSVANPEDRIFCLAFANGCPVLTMTKPPSGQKLWWHEGRSYSRESPPVGALDDTTLVAVPKVDRFGYGLAIQDAYSESLKSDFDIVKESDFWVLMQRKQ